MQSSFSVCKPWLQRVGQRGVPARWSWSVLVGFGLVAGGWWLVVGLWVGPWRPLALGLALSSLGVESCRAWRGWLGSRLGFSSRAQAGSARLGSEGVHGLTVHSVWWWLLPPLRAWGQAPRRRNCAKTDRQTDRQTDNP